MCEPKIDLSDVKVGDEVEDYAAGWGRIHSVKTVSNSYPIEVIFNETKFRTYTIEGMVCVDDVRPSIINIRKRKVKKQVTVYLNKYKPCSPFFALVKSYPDAELAKVAAAECEFLKEQLVAIAKPHVIEWEEEE